MGVHLAPGFLHPNKNSRSKGIIHMEHYNNNNNNGNNIKKFEGTIPTLKFEAALPTDEIVTETRQHAFSLAIATKYSVPIALWLQNLAFWTENNLALNINIHDGLCWTYVTLEAVGDKFPYMTKSQRETMINNSIKEGLVIKGNYNKNHYDRTLWYALTPKAYVYFAHFLNEKYMRRLYASISEKSEIDFGDFRNLFPKNRTPIPYTEPDTKTYLKHIRTSAEALSVDNQISENQLTEAEYCETFDVGYNDEAEEEVTQEGEVNKTAVQLTRNYRKSTKSDYQKNQTNSQYSIRNTIPSYLKYLKEENIFSIPEQALLDWIANRKKKRAAITQTAWNKINKELAKCKEQGIDPLDAFETMVASGWSSLKVDWFKKKKEESTFRWNLDSVMRA